MSFPGHLLWRIIGVGKQVYPVDNKQKTKPMFLLNLLEAKAVFLLMVFLLIVIPVWILLVAFTKKKGKADNINAPEEEETESSDEAVSSDEKDAEPV
jgi:zona occludens toxin (predicted ATPase)